MADALITECFSYINYDQWDALPLISHRYHRLMTITPRHMTTLPSLSYYEIKPFALRYISQLRSFRLPWDHSRPIIRMSP
jgi:hypothetical protein